MSARPNPDQVLRQAILDARAAGPCSVLGAVIGGMGRMLRRVMVNARVRCDVAGACDDRHTGADKLGPVVEADGAVAFPHLAGRVMRGDPLQPPFGRRS